MHAILFIVCRFVKTHRLSQHFPVFPRAWLGRPLLWAHKRPGNVVHTFSVTLLLPTKDVVIGLVSAAAASGEQGVCPAAGVGEVLGLVEGVGGHGDGAHGAHWCSLLPSGGHGACVRTRPAPPVNCDPDPGPHTAHVPALPSPGHLATSGTQDGSLVTCQDQAGA